MKLHTGHYYWPSEMPPVPQYPTLTEELKCEVLIVGGGIGGALSAHLLAEQGVDTILVERGQIAGGSSLASTGLLQYASDKTLTSCINTFGEEPAVHFYRLSQQALETLKQISAELKEAERLTERSSVYLASSEQDALKLNEEFETLQRFGFPAEWWTPETITEKFPFQYPGAIYTPGDAELNPFAFIHGILCRVKEQGVRVFEHSPVHGHEQADGGRIRWHCGEGSVSAKHVIWATGYETQQFKKESGATLTASYAIVTEQVNKEQIWYENSLIWETARPYLYMRTTRDGRIITGGLDEPLPPDGLQEGREIHQSKMLLEELHRLFPEYQSLSCEYAWGAVFGETRDGLPYIGPHPDFPGVYFLEGYGGNGTVCNTIAAEMIVDTLTGTPRKDMAMFSLTRTTRPNPK